MEQSYYFHCESEILKYNKDYQSLLQTLSILEAQKSQAIKDLELLEELQVKVEHDPLSVLNDLKEGSLVSQLPSRQTIAVVPDINWEQYNLVTIDEGYNTRKKKISVKENKEVNVVEKTVKDKQSSHGQPWTEEEQARLEEFLHIYPPEEIEAKRWQKIANALGNRTAKQVCCRVQKYFIKLAKAGLPVPGRMPNLATYSRKGKTKRLSTRRPSLFFRSLKPKVYMTNDNTESFSSDDDSSSASLSPPDTSNICTLLCSSCCQNLTSPYWQCMECVRSIHLCHQCINSEWDDEEHLATHEMKEVTQDESRGYIDKDYTNFNPSLTDTHYNYLDPNFCPAL